MSSIADQILKIINQQAPVVIKSQLEEKIKKSGVDVKVHLVNGKLSLEGEKKVIEKIVKS
jgi:sRNA-binding regulator protein Hfq